MEYAILALCIINFGLLIYLLFRKTKVEVNTTDDGTNKLLKDQMEATIQVKFLIDQLKGELPRIAKEAMNEEIIRLEKEFGEQNESSRNRLSEFERVLSDKLIKQFNELNETMNTRIKEIQAKVETSITGGFEGTSKAYKELTEQLTLIAQAKNNIEALSTEVVSLKNVLENNQNRGKFGEFTLERIIHSIFGDAKNGIYAFQYQLKNEAENERPDAVIFLPEPNKLLCIDSKFPFQDYKGIVEANTKEERDASQKGFVMAVKKHITDVASKYILKNTTADYALLFIPSDAIFAFINAECDTVLEYARSKKVILTSPSTLQPILATINLVRIQYERKKSINKVVESIAALSKRFATFMATWEKLSERVRQLDAEREKFDRNVRTINEQFTRIENVQDIGEESDEKSSEN